MHQKSAMFGLVALVVAAGAFAQAPVAPAVPLLQAVSPDMYTKLPIEQRQFYVAGVLDSDRVFFQQNKPMFVACLSGITIAQVTDIVDRGMRTLEPMLRSSMPIAVHNAILTDCNRRGFQVS
ncbi:hypothetical protein [Cupriavidus sp. AcVe19-1a]|uniref:hypothetical protein n=1 Tax=Cupriavidus sp. AcVe19-1a TaxID=2821359 RepID=UPI001AE5F935|nr:hypothetical protein [Cupriavidus sp. AcVe19-1a]MBP0631975.1 hypothetical protein [Cupriavidus sp. AcVe19-1a]